MFVHKSQLRPSLGPDCYVSEAQYQEELKHVFQPAWHLVATTHDLAKPGDFVTFDLLGRPVLLRNMEGEIRAFLNVCPHRHSRLTSVARGCSKRLRCQYHGWEFDAEGRTGRIPDAQCFRPFDRENAHLEPFRVATCGALVFISFDAGGPSLPEFLGTLYEQWVESFGGPFLFAGSWEEDFACNWKVVLENSLESYHVPCVHPKTFGRFPRAENCWHVLDERYTTFRTKLARLRRNRAQDWAVRRMGAPVTGFYEHQNIHPHLTYSGQDTYRLAMVVYPLSATTCRYRMYAFTLRGSRRGIVAPLLASILRVMVVRVAKQVYREDASIYRAVQEGIEASPHTGVIGTREERIYVFQEFVSKRCQADALGPAAGAAVEAPFAE